MLGLIAVVSHGTPLYEIALRTATAYGVLWFALVPAGPIRRFNLIGDYSYGIYILCFPIQQTLVMLYPEITPLKLLLASFPIVLALAILSWHFIEHPALKRKAWAGDSVGSLLHTANSGSSLSWVLARRRSRKNPAGNVSLAGRKREPGLPGRGWPGSNPLRLGYTRGVSSSATCLSGRR